MKKADEQSVRHKIKVMNYAAILAISARRAVTLAFHVIHFTDGNGIMPVTAKKE